MLEQPVAGAAPCIPLPIMSPPAPPPAPIIRAEAGSAPASSRASTIPTINRALIVHSSCRDASVASPRMARLGGSLLSLAGLVSLLARLAAMAMPAAAPHPTEPVHGDEDPTQQDPDPVLAEQFLHGLPSPTIQRASRVPAGGIGEGRR